MIGLVRIFLNRSDEISAPHLPKKNRVFLVKNIDSNVLRMNNIKAKVASTAA